MVGQENRSVRRISGDRAPRYWKLAQGQIKSTATAWSWQPAQCRAGQKGWLRRCGGKGLTIITEVVARRCRG
ncbi:hypothetical protein KCP69_25505 [Salmonella enterica subsp. enterica]|nr:hypothetical protein KCP69_25505 [Salmonella enterica subsp. enterica]